MSRWRWLWISLLAVVLTFEFVAIFNDEDGDTISENVWALLDLSWLLWVVMAGFLAWLTTHFLLPKVKGWWRRRPWR